CHAGCDQERVIATLTSRGLWMENGPRRFIRPVPRAAATSQPDRDDAGRSKAALAIWQSAKSAGGSLVEAYLPSRRLHLPPPPPPCGRLATRPGRRFRPPGCAASTCRATCAT